MQSADAQPEAGGPPAPRRLLIAEDEFLIAMMAEGALEDAGFAVVAIAATYDEAVDLAARTAPDLVLMDIRLASDRDGVDAAIEIRRRFGIPSLFASANIDPATMARAAAAEPAGWLPKPYTPEALLRSVSEALGLSGGAEPR